MSLLKLTVVSLCAALGASAAAIRDVENLSYSRYAVKERHLAPRAWKRTGPADGDALINLQFGLKQRDQDAVERHLLESSNPLSKRYGQHLSADDVRAMISPSDDTVALVEAWLEEHGVTSMGYSPAKDWISVVIPVSEAENLLDTHYSVFRHPDGEELTRAQEWSLPMHLHDHIEVVQPTTSFLRMSPSAKIWVGEEVESGRTEAQVQADSAEFVANGGVDVSDVCKVANTTPDCLRTLYGTIDYEVQSADANGVGICNYLNETSNRNDAEIMLNKYRPEAAAGAQDFKFEIIDNAPNPQGPYTPEMLAAGTNIEGNLDAQLVLAISWPTPMTAFSTGGSPPFIPDINTPTNTNEPYMTFLNTVLAQDNLPYVISTSYGDDEQTVPESYARRACHGYAQLGARGISVLFSSGDAGVGGDDTCYSNDGKNTTMFMPAFPAGCPWVTAVGGTANFMPETAVTRFASGAGFSNYFTAPDYQVDTVNAYIESLDGLYDGLYNKSGRGYPDVAAQGNHDAIVWNATFETVGGTSASCPTFSAIVALLNDALIAAGKPTLGFLNPWIYASAKDALTDVTIGSSFGCNTDGFPAQEGWDAVTGFGTPNFGKLLDLAMGSSYETSPMPGGK